MTEERYSGAFPEDLFAWQRVLFVAAGRGKLKARDVAVAGFVALTGDGTSGVNCRLTNAMEERLCAEFDVHRATIHRIFTKLRDEGWFVQTRKPTFRGKGRGQSALYRVAFPRLDLRHDNEPSRVAAASADVRFDSPVDNGVVSQNEPSRVAKTAESCRIATPDDATLPTYYLPTSNEPTCRGFSTASTSGHARDARMVEDHDFVEAWFEASSCQHCSRPREDHLNKMLGLVGISPPPIATAVDDEAVGQ